jgi:hypothetical protein
LPYTVSWFQNPQPFSPCHGHYYKQKAHVRVVPIGRLA